VSTRESFNISMNEPCALELKSESGMRLCVLRCGAVGGNLTYLWGIGSNRFGAGEAAGDSAGGGEGVTGGRPMRWADLFSFNALPPPDWLLVRGTLFGFARAGAEAAAGAVGGAGAAGGAGQVRSSSMSG
jgi:hypothetical protein